MMSSGAVVCSWLIGAVGWKSVGPAVGRPGFGPRARPNERHSSTSTTHQPIYLGRWVGDISHRQQIHSDQRWIGPKRKANNVWVGIYLVGRKSIIIISTPEFTRLSLSLSMITEHLLPQQALPLSILLVVTDTRADEFPPDRNKTRSVLNR